MRRISFVFVTLLLLTFGAGQTALAASSTASGSAKPLDLGAMALVPADLKAHSDADIIAGSRYGLDAFDARTAASVKAAGFIYGMEQWLGPMGVSGTDRTWQVATYLDVFQSAKGAHAGFPAEKQTSGKLVKTKTVGDESQVTFSGDQPDPNNQSKPDRGYGLVFRVGRVVATLFVDDYTGKSPKAADAEALARTLAARIGAVQSGKRATPGLSHAVLHFDEDGSYHLLDNYFRLDGKDQFNPRHYSSVSPQGPTFDQIYPHATDVYMAGQAIGDGADAPLYFNRLAHFTSRYWAAKWVKTYLAGAAKGPDGWQHVQEIKDARDFGDQSHTATFTLPAGTDAPGPTLYGTAIVARRGATAVAVRIVAYKKVPVSLVEGMMSAQLTCLASSSLCPLLKIPPAMKDLRLTSNALRPTRLAWHAVDRPTRAA